MNGLRLIFFCTAITLSLTSPAAAPAPASVPPQDAALRDLGRAWLEQYQGIGLSIGIYDDGKSYFYNFGATQLEGNRAPTKDTVYEIGSISKTMAGQLLARAIVESRAAAGDEIERYLGEPYPNLAQDGEKIRLIHLANMTSQLIDNIPDLTQVRLVPGEPLEATRMQVLERYTQAEFSSNCIAWRRGRNPAATRHTRTWPACCWVWRWRRSTTSLSRPSSRARSRSRCAWAAARSRIPNYWRRATPRRTSRCRRSRRP
jgi:CubicO group peptidase (beta-lactamase class C family)